MSVTDRIASLSPEQRALFEKLLEKRQKAARPVAPPPIPRVSGPTGEGDWPLSLDQERYWFMEQLYPGGAGLNLPAATRMRGRVKVPAFAAALSAVVRRHAAWRTTFPVVEGRPVQRVAPPRQVPPQRLPVIDLAGLPLPRREPETERLVRAEVAAPFDLERGVVRSNLVRLGALDHLCLLTVHHLATDFLSFQIAWTELAVLYDGFDSGRFPALPPPPVHYPDFAVWQRQWLTGEVLENLVAWWREQLADVPRDLDLPTDRPRPPAARLRGGQRQLPVSRRLSDGLRALGREGGATLFMTLLALTAALVRRLSGQERLILGANNANRNRPEIEPVLGCFLTQVPFAIDVTGDPAFRELLARVRQSALGAYAHQDLPFGQLVQALQVPRDPSRQPLVQALVQVLDGQVVKAGLADARFEPVDTYDGKARYDFLLTVFDFPAGLAGLFEYDADLFDATTVERWAELLLLQAAAAVADPDLHLSALPALGAAARHQALAEWNGDGLPAGFPGWTAAQRFAAQAARDPEAPAVVACGIGGACGETLTYGDLDRRATALAHRLRARGIGRESRVALLLGRSTDLPVALFGVWKAGGAYVPLDAESPPERLAALLADAAPAALVHRGPLPAGIPAEILSAVPGIDLAAPGEAPSPEPLPSLPDTRPGDLAYLIYTSGTTGQPKAVMVEHGNLAAVLGTVLAGYALGPGDRSMHLGRYTFDASLLEIVAPLVAGGTTEILASDVILDPAELPAALVRATCIFGVPAFLRQIVAGARQLGRERFAGLRTIMAGGDVVPPDLQAELLATFPGATLDVVYGPTETTIICVTHRLSHDRRPERALIGRPLPGVEARVADAAGRPVPLGVPGELWIGGPGVTRGYLHRPELTAERFVAVDGRRFYRSGDLVRQLPAAGGVLEFLGRIDHQVKVRGHRIEPGEVEAALARHPAVRESVVVASPGVGGERQLVAYVVAPDAPPALPEELRAFLRTLLPEPMVPSIFVPLKDLPRSPNGKVDRKALPAPEAALAASPGLATPAVLPRNDREERLAAIWRQVLGRERLGVDDNFFQLGGDSILSIQVVARARQAGLVLTPRQLFEHQTVAELAVVAGEVAGRAADDQGPVEGEAPLTPIEHLFFDTPRSEPWRFNQALLLAVREPLAAALLAAALARLGRHHDALRLRFVRQEDGWRQLHAPVGEIVAPLLEVDLRALPEAVRGPALEAAAEALQSGLDLERGPLFTAAIFRRGEPNEANTRLLLTAHHLIVDGVSWRVLLEDLMAAYRGLDLPAKTTSWKRWAERLAAYAGSPELAAELPFWLAIPAVPPLPVDLPEAPEAGRPARATVAVELGAAETRALLEEAPEAYRTQVNDLLLAALAKAFAGWTGERRLLVHLEGHGREEIFPGIDLSRTVGWFTTVFPVALELPPESGPAAAIKAIKERLRAVPHRGLGYGVLRYLAEPEVRERLAALPAPEVSFNYLGQLDPSLGQEGLFTLAPEAVRGAEGEEVAGAARFAIDAMVLDGRLRVSWTYDAGRCQEATAERLAEGFLAELRGLVEHCRSPLAGGYTPSDFPLAHLGQAALDRLLGTDRGVEDLYPLTPLQQGILFHSVHAGGEEIYLEQLAADLHGPLDVPALLRAWQRVVDRHTALRTAFLWQGVETPLQLVRRQVELPWSIEDWRALPAAAHPDLFAARLAANRAQGFDFARAPLTRLALVRTGESHHRLLWSFHHVLLDGWCFALILTEVFTLYHAEVTGRAPRLPRPRPYRDYIAWLAERGGDGEREAEAYWRRTLAGFTAPTSLPFDHPGAPAGRRADDFRDLRQTLPAPLVAALAELARRLRLTQNTLVEAAWALLLSRYAGLSDVLFGAVVSGRPADLPGVEGMVGLFINTLPVRVQIPDQLPAAGPAAGWLARLQANRQELYQHQWSPLPQVQTWAEIPPGEALFGSLLVFENYPIAPADPEAVEGLGGLRIADVSGTERTNYPLTLIVVARGELTLRLIADRRLEVATGQRLLQNLETLLAALAEDPEQSPLALPLATAAEMHQLTVEWNDTASPAIRSNTCLHELFAAQAARTPEATAVVDASRRWSYHELDVESNRIAWRLRQLGVGPEVRVGLCLGRSGRMVAAMLAVLKAGGAYVGLDPRYPQERLAFMLADSGAVALVAESAVLEALPAHGLPVVLLDGLDGEPGLENASAPASPPWSAAGPGNLAYLVYTSGSTGKPKGVAIEHASAVALVRWARQVFPASALGGVLAATSICFDLSVFEIFVPLAWGGRVIVAENALALPAHPAAAEVTLVNTVPSAMAELVRAGALPALPAATTTVNLAGEALTRELVEAIDHLLSPSGSRRVLNLYGPSEDTTYSTWAAVSSGSGSPPIGRPIDGTRAYVLDGRFMPVPLGAPGELHLAGAGLARGYLGQPERTAERFLPDPFSTAGGRGGERLYRTGDRARHRPDGNLDYLGRLDQQVKIRGFRVEPGEIEAALAAHPAVREAAVIPRRDGAEPHLVAYVVPRDGMPPAAADLLGFLAVRLPAYMVPTAFVTLDNLPLTPNGKLDRAALPAPDRLGLPAATWVAPSTPLEELLARTVGELLGVPRVGMRDNFFALGGHSLLATQLVSRLTQDHGIEMTVQMVFDTRDLGALADRIVEQELAAADDDLLAAALGEMDGMEGL